jgi:hypothetical protein
MGILYITRPAKAARSGWSPSRTTVEQPQARRSYWKELSILTTKQKVLAHIPELHGTQKTSCNLKTPFVKRSQHHYTNNVNPGPRRGVLPPSNVEHATMVGAVVATFVHVRLVACPYPRWCRFFFSEPQRKWRHERAARSPELRAASSTPEPRDPLLREGTVRRYARTRPEQRHIRNEENPTDNKQYLQENVFQRTSVHHQTNNGPMQQNNLSSHGWNVSCCPRFGRKATVWAIEIKNFAKWVTSDIYITTATSHSPC